MIDTDVGDVTAYSCEHEPLWHPRHYQDSRMLFLCLLGAIYALSKIEETHHYSVVKVLY